MLGPFGTANKFDSSSFSSSFHGNVQCYDEVDHLDRMILCRRDIDAMHRLPESEWSITIAGLPVCWIFPNVILMPLAAGYFLVRAYPDADDPGRHTSRIDFYMKSQLKNATGAEGQEIADFIATIAQNFAEIVRDENYVKG